MITVARFGTTAYSTRPRSTKGALHWSDGRSNTAPRQGGGGLLELGQQLVDPVTGLVGQVEFHGQDGGPLLAPRASPRP